MSAIYYGYLFEMNDEFRNKKYYSLLLASLQNDLSKWEEELCSDKTKYSSPKYSNSKFVVEVRPSVTFAYIYHFGNPPIFGKQAELISDKFQSDLINLVNRLRESVYTPEVYEIEKIVGTPNGRKEKLQFLEIEQIKDLIEDSYQDWLKDESETIAKFIARLMYSYRKKEDVYKLWTDKFDKIEMINDELKKLK